MASGTPPVGARLPRARYGRIRKLADRLAGKNMLTPRKLRNWIRGRLECQVQSVQRAQDLALPLVIVQEVCYHVCLDNRC